MTLVSQHLVTESSEKNAQHVEHREQKVDRAVSQQWAHYSPVLQLQRQIGNRGVARLIESKRITENGEIAPEPVQPVPATDAAPIPPSPSATIPPSPSASVPPS